MQDMEMFSTLVADAVLKKVSPVRDDISTREARAAYGTSWLTKATKAGLVDTTRDGNRVVYSRHQLDCLRAAERQRAELVFRKSKSNAHTNERKN